MLETINNENTETQVNTPDNSPPAPLACSICSRLHALDLVGSYCKPEIYEIIDGKLYYEPYKYDVYVCYMCNSLTRIGNFRDFPLKPKINGLPESLVIKNLAFEAFV